MSETLLGMPQVDRPPRRTGLRYAVRTFGCQMNEHDSERVAGLFERDGMAAAEGVDDADVVFINTCTIRENADNRLYGNLGQFKQLKDGNPDMLLVVGGYGYSDHMGMIMTVSSISWISPVRTAV